ncbi:MAG: response regulator [Candidatus Cloacimonetes bacterium HGW-Cloacimonetes-1]|jgi:DNA-binding NtrC family response regulator|nr:MAG: response regulator [Candidatus Cloacimonetes bacterium HGW-Cloacimonetes-1]
MNLTRILIADDDVYFCKLVSDLLTKEGYDTIVAYTPDECRTILQTSKVHILMLDMCYPVLSEGFELLEEVHEKYPGIVVLMISGEGNISDAVKAVKNGASDFIEKPISSEHLLLKIRGFRTRFELERKIVDLSRTAIGMIGDSPQLQKVYSDIIRAAQFDCPVLITGETGVGKELAAHAIHRLSKLRDKNIVNINCSAIPKDLFEAELFGYEQGAFTGAQTAHKGYFEFANNSTVFLDEISELPVEAQVKLLRVIAEGEIQKIGGRVQKVYIRLISATNTGLDAMITAGKFREDLYYRLSTIIIDIPPLRQRRDDIIPLATHFIIDFCNRNKLQPKSLTPQALAWLLEQEWKGNVRELRNVIERALVFSHNDHLTVADFMHDPSYTQDTDLSLRNALQNFEKTYIENHLIANEMSVSRTAEVLNIDKSNLSKKLKALGIRHGDDRD